MHEEPPSCPEISQETRSRPSVHSGCQRELLFWLLRSDWHVCSKAIMQARNHRVVQDGTGAWLLCHELYHDVSVLPAAEHWHLSEQQGQATVSNGSDPPTFTAVHLPRAVLSHPQSGASPQHRCAAVVCQQSLHYTQSIVSVLLSFAPTSKVPGLYSKTLANPKCQRNQKTHT